MKERDYKLVLTSFHPFTPRQAEIVQLLANGASNKEVSKKLGVSKKTINQIISFCASYDSIFDRIENLTGKRPKIKNWIFPLIDDVLFLRDKNGK
jgi:FixJ family two-component response regulator